MTTTKRTDREIIGDIAKMIGWTLAQHFDGPHWEQPNGHLHCSLFNPIECHDDFVLATNEMTPQQKFDMFCEVVGGTENQVYSWSWDVEDINRWLNADLRDKCVAMLKATEEPQ